MIRITAVCILACTILVAGARVEAATCQIGVKGGVAIQTFGGDDVESGELDSRTGFAGGAYFQADMSESFGIRLEALYFMKGASADSSTFTATFKLDYVEFPVLLMGHLPISETARLDIFAGPTFGFRTKADLEGSVGDFSATVDVSDFFNSFDMGFSFGAGLSFDVGSAILGIDGRYGIGVTSVAQDDPDTGEEADIKNQGFAFMASVGVPIGEK